MEFELTIRGDTSELPQFLKLLGTDTSSLASVDEEQASIPDYNLWTDESRRSFWEDMSTGAKELMRHCCVHVGRDVDVGEDGFVLGHCTDSDCREESREDKGHLNWDHCRSQGHLNWDHCRSPGGITGDQLLEDHGWSVQSIGARLANITINLKADDYLGLPTPIHRESLSSHVDGKNFKSLTNYRLDPEWEGFVFQNWVNQMLSHTNHRAALRYDQIDLAAQQRLEKNR